MQPRVSVSVVGYDRAMPTPPLPESPCVRVRLTYDIGSEGEGGNRFYLSYSGSAPSGANCITLADDISAAWATNIAPLCSSANALSEVDVLDIASDSGLSGQSTTTHDGSRSGSGLPVQVTTNVEFNIARRYRGGKPRMYLPAGVAGDELDGGHWQTEFITAVNDGVAAFFAEIEALSVGSMGSLAHVNLSYYDGYATTTPPWRGPGYKYPSKYRAAALLDTISGYSTKAVMGSQKRRRTSTTP